MSKESMQMAIISARDQSGNFLESTKSEMSTSEASEYW
jgi:hypothetical protein